jgi:glycosyltransferase involved in cell wall biosynthesis
VVCDDGSCDGSQELVKEFSRRASFPIRLVTNHTNLGTTRNFEKAISLCRGDIILLADQDDVWLHHKLRTIEEQFLLCPELAAAFSDGNMITENSELLSTTLWQSHSFGDSERSAFAAGGAFDLLLKRPVVTGATLAFRKEYCDVVLPIPSNQMHDYWISLLLSACGRIQPIAEPLIQYRRHKSQQSGPGRKKTLAERFAQARTRGRNFYQNETESLEQWKQRLLDSSDRFTSSSYAIRKLEQKIAHGKFRATLPVSTFGRWPLIFQEVLNRNYWHYSDGWKSIGKDLFLMPRR